MQGDRKQKLAENLSSVPDLEDPQIFWPPGSWSVRQKYGSGQILDPDPYIKKQNL